MNPNASKAASLFLLKVGLLFLVGSAPFVLATGSGGGSGTTGVTSGHYGGPGDTVPPKEGEGGVPNEEGGCGPAIPCNVDYDKNCPATVLPLTSVSNPAPIAYWGMYTLNTSAGTFWVYQYLFRTSDFHAVDQFLQTHPQYIDSKGNVTLELGTGDGVNPNGGTFTNVPATNQMTFWESDYLNGNFNFGSHKPFCLPSIPVASFYELQNGSCAPMNGNAPPNAKVEDGYILHNLPATMPYQSGNCQTMKLKAQINWECLTSIVYLIEYFFGPSANKELFMWQFKTCVTGTGGAPYWTAFGAAFPGENE